MKTLEIEENLRAQHWVWKFQKIGIVLMSLFVIANVLGFLSPGIFSEAQLGAEDHFKLTYEKVLHYRDVTTLRVDVGPAAIKDGLVQIDIDKDYIKNTEVEKIIPEPREVQSAGEHYRYVFSVAEGNLFTALFHIRGEERGPLKGRVSVPHQPALEISQFVFP